MFRKLASPTYCVLLCIASLFTSCQDGVTVNEPSDHSVDTNEMIWGTIIYRTDSDEWRAYVPYVNIYANDPFTVDSPYHVPTREEAKVLRTLTFGNNAQRFLTDDGYTFGMPSASITKAGLKTKYSVLALWRRSTIIDIGF